MYRGSCQVDSGVVLRVDAKTVTYLAMTGEVRQIPRYEIVGVASYPLPSLPVDDVLVPPEVEAPFFSFVTYRRGGVEPLVTGWPIDYNAEHIQVLARDGQDYLVERDDIWGVRKTTPQPRFRLGRTAARPPPYKLRHPLAFERCPDNVTPGQGTPVAVIPQTTYDSPIAIKRYHDHLRDGYAKVEDYEDRQRFYAIPQYYGNQTRLGTWALVGSRYANVGSRRANFLPLVEDELSEGPFGFQRLVRSGVAPLRWSVHEEPIVQAFYGLKADYVHFEAFFDPTAPLIGVQYDYAKGQLASVDDRLIEKGGLEFGVGVGYVTVMMAYTEGNIALRLGEQFVRGSFGLPRYGIGVQLNYYKLGFYAGSSELQLDDEHRHALRFLKVYGSARLLGRLTLDAQYIDRTLQDQSDPAKAFVHYTGRSSTLATEAAWALTYRWTVRVLASLERQSAEGRLPAGGGDSVDKLWPKLASGVTIAF